MKCFLKKKSQITFLNYATKYVKICIKARQTIQYDAHAHPVAADLQWHPLGRQCKFSKYIAVKSINQVCKLHVYYDD